MKKHLLIFIALLFTSVFINAQVTIFSENFDSYTAGQTVYSQQPLIFPWTGQASENAYVSNSQASSPENSMKIINDNDMIFRFGNKTSGEYNVYFKMFIVSGKGGYFNVEHTFGVDWAFAFYFRTNSVCEIKQGGTTTTFNYDMNTWLDVKLNLNLNTDIATAWVNDVQVATWTFSNDESEVGGDVKLDVINFYGLHQTSTGVNNSEFYIDDFEYEQVDAGITPPTIVVDNTAIVTDGSAPIQIVIENSGELPLVCKAYPVFNDPGITSNLGDGEMKYYDEIVNGIGWASSFEVDVAVRFNTDIVSQHIGQKISYVTFGIGDLPVNGEVVVYIWEKGDYSLPGTTTVLFQQTVVVTENTMNGVQIDPPIYLNGDEIWIGYHFTTPQNLYTVLVDDLSVIPGTCYLRTGPTWSEFSGVDGNGNFVIGAELEGQGWPIWLNVSPNTGNIEPSQTATLNLSFNLNNLTQGTYSAKVVIGANDPDQQWTEIPVQLDYFVGINSQKEFGIMTYPNPAYDFVNVVSDINIESINIFNIAGQLVMSQQINAQKASIDITQLPIGNYVVQVSADGQIAKTKLIKE